MRMIDSDLIDRQEAIDAVRRSEALDRAFGYGHAVDALRELPSAQPETHEERTETHACDLISRQAAIDAHYEYCNKHPDAGFPVWSLKILEDLPSAQPDLSEYSDKLWKAAYERGKAEAQQRWIPCSERLPEQQQTVLIQDFGQTTIGYLNAENKWRDLANLDDYLKGVEAWMPLPEPYAERRTDEKENI